MNLDPRPDEEIHHVGIFVPLLGLYSFRAFYIVIFATDSSYFQLHRISGTVKRNVLKIRLLIRLFSWIHRVVYRLSGGRVGFQLFGAPVLLLTTKGRKTGKARTSPLLYLEESSNWVVVGSNAGDDRHPTWWLNLKAHPVATVQIGNTVKPVRAREASEEEKSLLWPRFVDMYSDYETYRQRTTRKIPVVILEAEAD